MLIGADEEGGTVVRVSANPDLRDTRFSSPQKLYAEGGLDRIRSDTEEKDALLLSLGHQRQSRAGVRYFIRSVELYLPARSVRMPKRRAIISAPLSGR